MTLEDRLANHLRQHAETDRFEPTAIDTVRTTARRRSVRTRLAVGCFGLVALAGAASLIPTNSEPSALVTANDPENTPTPAVTTPEPAVATPQPAAATPQPAAATPQPAAAAATQEPQAGDPAGPPPGFRTIADGSGGFVGIAVSSSAGRVRLVQSANGTDWFRTAPLQLDQGRYAAGLQHVDNHIVAVIGERRTDASASGFGGLLVKPSLMITQDLINWTPIDLGLDDELAEAEAAGDANSTGESEFAIVDIAIVDDLVLTAIGVRPSVDYERVGINEADVCGQLRRPNDDAFVLCDGTEVPVGPIRLTSGDWSTRLVLSKTGQPATQVADPRNHAGNPRLFVRDGEFRLTEMGSNFAWRSSDGREWELAERTQSVAGFGQIQDRPRPWPQDSSQVDSGWIYRYAGGIVSPEFPPEVPSNPSTPAFLNYGPAGWAAIVSDNRNPWIQLTQGEWTYSGIVFGSGATVRSSDGNETFNYERTGIELPPNMAVSFFGTVRMSRPGTDEALIELPSDAVRQAEFMFQNMPPGPPTGEFVHTFERDGWELSGDPINGPLVLTSPGGTVRTFGDGFAFTNGDTSDGIELIDVSPHMFPRADARVTYTRLHFFEDGDEPVFTISSSEMYNHLVLPAIGVRNADGELEVHEAAPPSARTWVLHSVDGLSWQVVWSETTDVTGARVLVGDDEILIGAPSGITVIPLDAADE